MVLCARFFAIVRLRTPRGSFQMARRPQNVLAPFVAEACLTVMAPAPRAS